MSIPLPPKKKSGELNQNEYTMILDSTLSKRNRDDPNVIAFIDSFLRCKSITQAAAEVGINNKIGYLIRHRKDVAKAIQKFEDKSHIKYGFDKSEIFERAKEVAEFDPISVQNADGTYKKNLHDVEPEARRCIKELTVKNLWNQVEDKNGIKSKIIIGEVISYKFYDKLKAVELTGKEKEMFKNTTKVEHDITKNMASVLLDSTHRADQRVIDITPEDVTHL